MTESADAASISGAQRAAPGPIAADHTAKGTGERLALVGIIALALAVRAYYTTYSRVVWGDEPFYLWLGHSLWSGTGYSVFGYSGAHFPPLFPLLAGGLAPFVGGLQAASNLLYVICGGLLVWPLYALARWIYGRPAAVATGLIAAVYPALTTGVLAWGTMTEPLSLLLTAAAICALYLALERGKWGSYAALGVTLGLCYLTRTDALAFAAAACVLLAAGRVVRGERVGAVARKIGLTILLFLLISSPYLLYMRAETGRWSLTGAAGMAYVSMEGLATGSLEAFDAATWSLDPASGEVYLFAQASEQEGFTAAVVRQPVAFLRRVRANLANTPGLLFSVTLVAWPLGVLAALGLFLRPWDRRCLRGQLALLASLASPLSYLLFFIQGRYLAGMLIPAMVWIGAGCVFLGDWLADTWAALRMPNFSAVPAPARSEGGETPLRVPKGAAFLAAAPTILVVAALLWLGPRQWTLVQRTHSFQPGHLLAAEDLRNRGVTPETVVMSRYPAIAFHAGTRWAATPAATWDELEAYARSRGARYLAFDGWEARLRPQLSFLLDPGRAPATLHYLSTVDAGHEPVVLYEFLPASDSR